MKQYVIWFIFLQLCSTENLDYNDYYPKNIPHQNTNNLQYENPSPEYKAVMTNLCDNWQSPISYLKKRGYMPEDKPTTSREKHSDATNNKEVLVKGKNYFFFPQDERQNLNDNINDMKENEKSNVELLNTKATANVSHDPDLQNNNIGIINKVKEKFLSIFSHKDQNNESLKLDKSDLLDRNYYDIDDPELFDDYEQSKKRLFVRSATEKPEGLLSNLSDSDIQYVKSFINCFKKSKQDFQIQLLPKAETTTLKPYENSTSTTTNKPNADSKTNEIAKQNEIKSGNPKTSQTPDNVGGNTTYKSVTESPTECVTVCSTMAATNKGNAPQGSTKTAMSNFTVDLDINQKNGTGEDLSPSQMCQCTAIVTNTTSPPPIYPETGPTKYITKSKFLAHLHHMVDEVGKPPHKPLNLKMVQDDIDKIKYLPTVIMADGKTTQCAPLRMNDMSFDLEWKKIEKSTESNREKLNTFDLDEVNQPAGQSLAAKFLQDVKSFPNYNEKPVRSPYSDNFLDAQRSLPDDLELPLKISTKREAFSPNSPSHGHKLSKLLSDIASLPDPQDDDDDYYMDDNSADYPKRRIKGKLKNRGKKKLKAKFRNDSSNNNPSDTANIDIVPLDSEDMDEGNDFNSFEELKDIQFRVNNDDEEAISKFIANLNSPPEVFSFDVDKFLRSAKQDMEPQAAPGFEIQSPKPRTYYEFMEAPAVEKERLPLIESPLPSAIKDDRAIFKKRAKSPSRKRDLLRQYIKGVSSALNHNFPEQYADYNNRESDIKSQRSPTSENELSIRTNNLVDGFSGNLDAMNYIKSSDNDEFLDKFYLLNDGSSQVYDLSKQDILPEDRYCPQSLELDLDLNKKFQELDLGAYNGYDRMQQNFAPVEVKNMKDVNEDKDRMERRDFESVNDRD